MRFILTIDSEADNQWKHGVPVTTENIRKLPDFQRLCESFFVRPTYLLTSEVCDDKFAQSMFKDYATAGRAEIGAHLHVWTTPPFKDQDGLRQNDVAHAFATELDSQLLASKLSKLTDQVANVTGHQPRSFRAGRFGFDHSCARILADLGYRVDSSITPFTDWSSSSGIPGGIGGPDFGDEDAFHTCYSFGTAQLWEIPITILPTTFPFNRSAKATQMYVRNMDAPWSALLRRLGLRHQPLWLRPFPFYSPADLEAVVEEAERREMQFIVMMFHSSELLPGGSPYWPYAEDVDRLLSLLQSFFRFISARDISAVTLGEAADELAM